MTGLEPRPHRAIGRLLDVAVILVVVALIALPFAARAAVADAGIAPAAPAAAAAAEVGGAGKGTGIQNLPILTDGPTARLVQDGSALSDPQALREAVIDLATRLFGSSVAADALWQVMVDHPFDFFPYEGQAAYVYPYRYKFLDPILDAAFPEQPTQAQLDLANDLAALLILTGATIDRDRDKAAHQTPGTAYALLDRVRRFDRSCRAQLNLAFLVSLAGLARPQDIALELEKAHDACPGDPTPLWLLGQVQSARAFTNPTLALSGSLKPSPPEEIRRAFATYERLQKELPGSAAGWAGAADAEVLQAEQAARAGIQPFTSRNRYTRAVALYEHAAALSDEPGVDAGLARALSGLGRFDDAIAAARKATAKVPDSAALRAILIETLERAGRFGEAATAAAAGAVTGPSGRWLTTQGLYYTIPPMSLGFERVRAVDLTVGYEVGQGGGAYAYDTSFVPVFRTDSALTGSNGWCPVWTIARDSILAGRPSDGIAALTAMGGPANADADALCPAEAAANKSAAYDTQHIDLFDLDLQTLGAVVSAEAGDRSQNDWLGEMDRRAKTTLTSKYIFTSTSTDPVRAYVFDHWQNLWRYAGNLRRAAKVTDAWVAAIPNDPAAQDRAGEVAFLQGDYRRAADHFGQAVGRLAGENQAVEFLKLGAAQGLAGNAQAARVSLGRASSIGLSVYNRDDTALYARVAAYFAQFQLGDISLRARDYQAAVASYTEAITLRGAILSDEFDAYQLFGLEKGADENNLAIASILLGAGADAERQAAAALTRDAESPIFQQTLAYAYQSEGEWQKATATYRQSLDADPTLFPAANDLGVIAAQQGRPAEAVTEFRKAVGAKPAYALGWFNLGVQLGRMGPAHFLEAQGALGRAVALDPGLRDRDRELVFDTDPYFSGLDLSRPLPPQWRFAQHERRAPAALTILAILLLLVRLLWNLGLDKATGTATEKALGWLAWLRRPFFPLISVFVLIGLFCWPLVGSPGVSVVEVAVLGIGVLGLTGVYLRTRTLAARRSQLAVRHYTWLPSLAIGAALTAVGLSFAPVPAADLSSERRLVRWIGPAALAVCAAALLGIAFWTGVPATRALGTSAVVMLGSVLLPLRPFDGAYLRSKAISLTVTLAMLAVSIVLFLGWI